MKKKLVAIVMCLTMSACLFVGCGSDNDVVEEATEVAETEATEVCSDATFSDLQDAFAYLTDEYNMVEDFYLNNSDIPQDDDVESALSAAKEYLDTMGDINQADITEADAEEIGNSMIETADALAQLAEALGIEADAAASADACSDETFSSLQEAYSYLAEEYNAIVDFYQNNDSVPQNDDVEATLSSAKEYLDEVGDIEQSTITEDDAEELAQSMVDVASSLATLAEAIAQ